MRDAAIVHGLVLGCAAMFGWVNLRYERFRCALDGFDAVYQFRAGSAVRRLIFSGGRIRTRLGAAEEPDYELALIEPVGVVRCLVNNPDDMIKLLMENKIDQQGNNFYLFKFGYLLGLCDRYFQEVRQTGVPDFFKRFKTDPENS